MSSSAPANASLPVSDGYNVASGAHFLKWWKQHLIECIPSGVRQRSQRGARPLMLSTVDGKIWPSGADFGDSAPLARTKLLSGDAAKLKPATLLVGERNGFRREVALPITVEDRLAQVLAFELDRLTPLKPDDLYYDFRVLRRDNAKGICVAEVLAAPKARVDAMIKEARELGADVDRLVLSTTDVDHGIDLFKLSRKQASEAVNSNWLTPLLALLCLGLVIALVAYPIFKKRQYVIALMPTEAAARAEAETATVIQRQLDKQLGEYNLLLKRKHATPIAVQVLEDIGKRLPDDTWAQSFEIKPQANSKTREVIVQGETGSGAKLLQIVQESSLLKEPVLKAAMTRVAPNAERFHFAGELVSVAAPAGMTLADSATLLGTPMQVAPSSAAGAPLAAGKATDAPKSSATDAPKTPPDAAKLPSPAVTTPSVSGSMATKAEGTKAAPPPPPAAMPPSAVPEKKP
jgi:general secretion pathway protein L